MIFTTFQGILRRHDRFHQPDRREILFFAAVSLLSFLPFLGATPLFDWDEINFAEAAREMLVTGDYLTVKINYEAFWEKPPLFFWLQALSFKIFGIGEFSARLPNAILGVFVIPSLYVAGTRLAGRTIGRLSAGLYFATLLSHLYFKTGIIDPYFNFFIFLALYNLLRLEILKSEGSKELGKFAALAGLWTGLAVLTKGPVGLLMVGLTYVVFKIFHDRFRVPWKEAGIFLAVLGLITLLWFGSLVAFTADGFATLTKFYNYHLELLSQDVAGHAQPFYYHFLVFTLVCFPMAAFCYRGMLTKQVNENDRILRLFMLVWWWVVMIVFSIVKTKIVHYSSLLYYPAAFLGALYLREILTGRTKVHLDVWIQIGLGIVLFGLTTSAINIVVNKLPEYVDSISDEDVSGMLSLDVPWTGFEFLLGLSFLLGSLIAVFQLKRRRVLVFLGVQMITTAFWLNGLNLILAPKVSAYVQDPAIEFWKSHAGEDVYLMTSGYKSYAQLFYGQVPDYDEREMSEDEFRDWLNRGDVDKDVYMVAKRHSVGEKFRSEWHSNFEEIGSKGAFVFFKRRAK